MFSTKTPTVPYFPPCAAPAQCTCLQCIYRFQLHLFIQARLQLAKGHYPIQPQARHVQREFHAANTIHTENSRKRELSYWSAAMEILSKKQRLTNYPPTQTTECTPPVVKYEVSESQLKPVIKVERIVEYEEALDLKKEISTDFDEEHDNCFTFESSIQKPSKRLNAFDAKTYEGEMTEIGSGIKIPRTFDTMLRLNYSNNPAVFLRRLFYKGGVFTLEEIAASSITGKRTPHSPPQTRPALDADKFNALKEYTIACCGLKPNTAEMVKFESRVRCLCTEARKILRKTNGASGPKPEPNLE